MKNIIGIFLSALFVYALPVQAALDNANSKTVSTIEMASISTAGDVHGLYLPSKAVVTAVYVANTTAIAADATNYVTLKVMVGTEEVSSYDSRATAQGALVANVPKASIITQGVVPAGSYLKVAFGKGGTGAMTGGKVFIQWYEK